MALEPSITLLSNPKVDRKISVTFEIENNLIEYIGYSIDMILGCQYLNPAIDNVWMSEGDKRALA